VSGDDEVDDKMRRAGMLLEGISGDTAGGGQLRKFQDGEDLEAAVAIYTQVIEMAPHYAEGWNKRATAYYMMKDFSKSLDDCKKVLELKPRHFGCLSGKGMCYMQLNEREKAIEAFKAALAVNPMGGSLAALDRLERDNNMVRLLGSRADQVIQFLEGGDEPLAAEWAFGEPNEGIDVDWDVHKIESTRGGSPLTYFFRVVLRNKGLGTVPLRSLGRFYVLRFASGKVVPLMRPTEGAAEFILEPGEEYRYSWIFSVVQGLEEMHGGMLLDRPSRSARGDSDRYVAAQMEPLQVSDAEEVGVQQLERLAEGHIYMGQLDLTQIDN
jgi:hypothetical protein